MDNMKISRPARVQYAIERSDESFYATVEGGRFDCPSCGRKQEQTYWLSRGQRWAFGCCGADADGKSRESEVTTFERVRRRTSENKQDVLT